MAFKIEIFVTTKQWTKVAQLEQTNCLLQNFDQDY